MSDSVQPYGWQPTRLPDPWNSPGKNTGVGCHFLLQCMKVSSESEVAQSCLTFSDPMDCSPPGYSAHRIFQARILEWGAIAFSNMLAQCTHILHVMEVVHSSYGGWIVLLPKQRSLKSSQQHSYKIDAISHLLIAVTPLRKKALSVPFKVLKLWMMRIITDPGSWGHKHWGFKFMTSPGSLLS